MAGVWSIQLETAVVAAGRHPPERFEGWIVAGPDRRTFAVRHVIPVKWIFPCRSTERNRGGGYRAGAGRDGRLIITSAFGNVNGEYR